MNPQYEGGKEKLFYALSEHDSMAAGRNKGVS
jgi:hypothetical protein